MVIQDLKFDKLFRFKYAIKKESIKVYIFGYHEFLRISNFPHLPLSIDGPASALT